MRVARDGRRGTATLVVDGQDAGSVDIPEMATMVSSTGMDVGRSVAPVCHDYAAPFPFGGELRSVTFEIAPSAPRQQRQEALVGEKVTMGQQ